MFRGREKRHIVSILDFSKENLLDFLHITERIKSNQEVYRDSLAGRSMARVFCSDSTRTHDTHVEAMERLGGRASLGFRNPQGTSMIGKKETLKSTLRMYMMYGADVIVLRHKRDGSARYAADIADGYYEKKGKNVWIINGGDGNNEHPTQNLMDMYTIKEKQGKLDGLKIVFFGDLRYGRTTRLVYPMSKFEGNRYIFLSHPDVSMPEHIKDFLREKGESFEEHSDPGLFPDIIREADVAYGSRNQEERWPKEKTSEGDEMRREVRDCIVLSKSVINKAGPKENFIVMHPLPIDQYHPCISSDVEDTPYCWYDEEAENGVYSRMGILYSQFHSWWLDG